MTRLNLSFAAHLQSSATTHVAESTSGAYVGPWNAFVIWCAALFRHRRPFSADDLTVVLCIKSFMEKANLFSTIKNASVSITIKTLNPTMAPEVCMVRTAVARKFGFEV